MLGTRTRTDGSLIRPTSSRLGSKKAMAIAIGIFCCGVFALLNQYGLFSFTAQTGEIYEHPQLLGKQQSSKCESSEYINIMKSQYIEASDENEELKKKVDRLTQQLSSAKQEEDIARRQVLMLGKHQPAGPFGTVKSLRTSPTVAPNPTVNPRLAKILEVVAVEREVIVALANKNVGDLLEVWFSTIKRVGISNYLVVALDDVIANFCRQKGVPVYRDEETDLIERTSDNHVISGLKFRILREFLQLGYSVLLSDVDIVFLQNPFDHLHRDSDIESMTDGHDNSTAYGYDDLFDDPAMGLTRYAHTFRLWMYNSGFFFIRPTVPSIELLDRVAARLSRGVLKWDQAVFNEELFLPSRPGYEGLHASRRTLDFYLFMNSKVLFKMVRKDARFSKLKPVIVHVNYHPDKLTRMEAVVEYYINGKQDALDALPVGSEG